jgi:hypothetical protein
MMGRLQMAGIKDVARTKFVRSSKRMSRSNYEQEKQLDDRQSGAFVEWPGRRTRSGRPRNRHLGEPVGLRASLVFAGHG